MMSGLCVDNTSGANKQAAEKKTEKKWFEH